MMTNEPPTRADLGALAADAGLDPAGWTPGDHAAAVKELLDDMPPGESCPQLARRLDAFMDDPMTAHYGAYDCADLIVREHVQWHGCTS